MADDRHFARTIRLDATDSQCFASAAAPGEWAISGAFLFADMAPSALAAKDRLAFGQGFLGTESFGWSTFVAVHTISQEEYVQLKRALSDRFVRQLGAPSPAAAETVAEEEMRFMAELCGEHPVNQLLRVEREFGEDGVIERITAIAKPDPLSHAKIWDIVPDA